MKSCGPLLFSHLGLSGFRHLNKFLRICQIHQQLKHKGVVVGLKGDTLWQSNITVITKAVCDGNEKESLCVPNNKKGGIATSEDKHNI